MATLKNRQLKENRFIELLRQYPLRKEFSVYQSKIIFSVGHLPCKYQKYAEVPDEETTSFGFYDITEAEYELFIAFLDSPFAKKQQSFL